MDQIEGRNPVVECLVRQRRKVVRIWLDRGAKPLFVCRQAGTSLAMIGRHYGASRTIVAELDRLLGSDVKQRETNGDRNPSPERLRRRDPKTTKTPGAAGGSQQSG